MARFLPLFALAFAISATEARAAKVLVITGDEYHAWKQTAPFIKDLLAKAGHTVEVTETPSKDLTPENLKRFDVLVLNYRNTPKGAKDNPASVWSNENKQAFLDAIQGGKGLYVYHWASSAFTTDSAIDKEYERALAGGWRKQGNHGKPHAFSVTVRKDHPVTAGVTEFMHGPDELYQNSVMFPESTVLATAFADSKIDPKNSGKHEPVVWIAQYGKGRVVENVLGHDVAAMQGAPFQKLLVQGVSWAAGAAK